MRIGRPLPLIPLGLSPEVRSEIARRSLGSDRLVSPMVAFADLSWADAAVERIIFLADEAEAWAEQEQREAARI
jgi:hypothetical protein